MGISGELGAAARPVQPEKMFAHPDHCSPGGTGIRHIREK